MSNTTFDLNLTYIGKYGCQKQFTDLKTCLEQDITTPTDVSPASLKKSCDVSCKIKSEHL